MKENLKRAFLKISLTEKDSLAEEIWHAIVLREKRTNRRRLWAFSLIGLFSFIGFVPAFGMLLSDFARSGFYEYLSLAFSSSGSIITYWREFLSLLAESLPVISITLSLTFIFIFFLSLKYAMREIIKSQLTLSF